MKILVFSDSHRTIQYMIDAIDEEKPSHIIHLGDHVADAEELGRLFPMLPILRIRGNCDFDFICQDQVFTEYDGVKIFAVHGHRYGVKSGLLHFSLAAQEKQADVALFGHTHRAFCEQYENLWLLNPGSCGYSSRPTCGIIEIQGGIAQCRIKAIDERR